jgi:hypothetical protein
MTTTEKNTHTETVEVEGDNLLHKIYDGLLKDAPGS